MVYLCVYTHPNIQTVVVVEEEEIFIKNILNNNTRASFIDFVFKRLVYNCVYIVVGV